MVEVVWRAREQWDDNNFMDAPGTAFRSRVILLGASNLTLGFPLVVSELRRRLPPPIQILAAHGHGRSYGDWSYVLFYGLPGITRSDLWKCLQEYSSVEQTYALVTDIGNDLIYGTEPELLLSWVKAVLAQLGSSCEVVITRLPIASALSVGLLRYHLTKQLFFPGPMIPWQVMQERTKAVDNALVSLAAEQAATLHQFERHDYGLDRIHLRYGKQLLAWQGVFEKWGLGKDLNLQPSTWTDRRTLWSCYPSEYRLWRTTQRVIQPCVHWPDGSELCLF